MSVIGTFTRAKDGGWTGHIRTLTIDLKVRFVPNDNRPNEAAPLFRLFAGRSEIGAAWAGRRDGPLRQDFLSVRLDDPCLGAPIHAALLADSEHESARLVWSRRHVDE